MSRLDRHVSNVQGRMALRKFLQALAWNTLVLAAAVLLGVIVNLLFRIFTDNFPRFPAVLVICIGFGVCVAIAGVMTYLRRPTREQAATAIDETLGLKEKFSTAIYVRPSSDPFAQAAVRDAEQTATRVDLGKKFPVPFPRVGYWTILLAALAYGLTMIQPFNLFGAKPPVVPKLQQAQEQQAAKEAVARALEAIDSSTVKSTANNEEFRKLVAELRTLATQPKLNDPAQASRRALQALQELNDQVAKDWDKAKKYAEAQNAFMQSLNPPDDAKGPVGEARKELAKGNFDKASEEMKKAVKDFDKMDQKQKQDQAKQMQQAANQLQQLANNPQVQQQIQQQLQQMGANQQQAQQMANMMQQAAQGGAKGQQAAQQLAQQAQQLAQQMNNGQGANAQQQQAIQQAIQQMQAQANAQNQANGLAQAAQQMANAMQQAGQQQANNGQANPQQAQQMQQAQQAMQNALNNMNGVKQDLNQIAQQMQNAQNAMQQGQQCANGQCQGGPGQQGNQNGNPGNQGGPGQQPGGPGNPQNKGPGMGGPGIGAGGVAQKDTSPYGVKMEQSQSQDSDNPNAKWLASYLVKDRAPVGEQRTKLAEIAQKAPKEAADEVDSEHANRQAQKAAQEYFRTMAKDNGAKDPGAKETPKP